MFDGPSGLPTPSIPSATDLVAVLAPASRRSALLGQALSVPLPAVKPKVRKAAGESAIQEEIVSFVQENPGATIAAVAEYIHCTHSTATYHLQTLVRLGILQKERDGREVRHFCADDTRQPVARLAVHMRDPKREAVVSLLVGQRDWASINRMASTLEVPFNSLKGALRALHQDGFVELQAKNGRYHIRCNESLRLAYRKFTASSVGRTKLSVPATTA